MRIIGELPHPSYKISLLSMNNNLTVQISDGALVQSYTFRDGSEVQDISSAQLFVDNSLSEITEVFARMAQVHGRSRQASSEDSFPTIL